MPDFFFGSPIDYNAIPADTDEKKAKVSSFFAGPAALGKAQENVHKVLPELKTTYPSVEKWGVIGYCWGGKVRAFLTFLGDAMYLDWFR